MDVILTHETNKQTDDPPYYTCKVYTIVMYGVVLCGLCTLSFVGNIINFVTWTKITQKKGWNSSTILMQYLAVADFIGQIPVIFVVSLPNIAFQTGVLVRYFCQVSAYLTRFLWPFASMGNFATVWLTTLITIHRFGVLCKPFSRITQTMTTVKSTFIQAGGILLFSVIYNAPRFFEYDIVEIELTDGSMCKIPVPTEFRQTNAYQVYHMTICHLIVVNGVPLMVSLVLTIEILHTLFMAKARRKTMTSSTHSTSNSNRSAASSRESKELAVTKTLLTIVIFFIICQIPNTCYRIWLAFNEDARLICGTVIFYINSITQIFIAFNTSVNVFVYMYCSGDFRVMLKHMFCCKKEVLLSSGSVHESTAGSQRAVSVSVIESTAVWNHIIIRAAFVCLFVPLLLRGPLTDLRQTWWVYVGGPRNCPWGVLFWKGRRVDGSTGQTSLFRSRRHQAETTPLQKAHGVFCRARRLLPSKRHMASKSLIPSTGIFTSENFIYQDVFYH